jgi:hypothetical protein
LEGVAFETGGEIGAKSPMTLVEDFQGEFAATELPRPGFNGGQEAASHATPHNAPSPPQISLDFRQRNNRQTFHAVRYFGWLHPSAKARRMVVETLLAKPIVVTAAEPPPQWHLRCPHCERFTLVCVGSLPKQARAPPACVR